MPEDYTPDQATIDRCNNSGVGKCVISHDLNDITGADAVYTDVWASMGQKDEAMQRKDFAGFCATGDAMKKRQTPSSCTASRRKRDRMYRRSHGGALFRGVATG